MHNCDYANFVFRIMDSDCLLCWSLPWMIGGGCPSTAFLLKPVPTHEHETARVSTPNIPEYKTEDVGAIGSDDLER